MFHKLALVLVSVATLLILRDKNLVTTSLNDGKILVQAYSTGNE